MSTPEPLFVEGTVVDGSEAGMAIRIEEDIPGAGSYLIILFDRERTDVGGDYWVECYDDLAPFFREAGWQISWDAPIETLRSCRRGASGDTPAVD